MRRSFTCWRRSWELLSSEVRVPDVGVRTSLLAKKTMLSILSQLKILNLILNCDLIGTVRWWYIRGKPLQIINNNTWFIDETLFTRLFIENVKLMPNQNRFVIQIVKLSRKKKQTWTTVLLSLHFLRLNSPKFTANWMFAHRNFELLCLFRVGKTKQLK